LAPRSFSRLRWLLLATLALYGAFAGARLVRYGDPSAFIGFGCHPSACFAEANRALLPKNAIVYETGGYDGQFYYYIAADLARDLFGISPAGQDDDAGIAAEGSSDSVVLDAPIFRRTRILYPLLSAPAFALGPEALVAAMALWPLALHFAALFVLHRFYRARLARRGFLDSDARQGAPDRRGAAAAGLWIFALNPFSLVSFAWALADGIALALVAMGMAYHLQADDSAARSRWLRRIAGVALIALAALAKETALVIPLALLANRGIGLAVGLLGQSGRLIRRSLGRMALALMPIGALALWYAALGYSPVFAAARGADIPFGGLVEYLRAPDALLSGRSFLVGLLAIYLGLALLFVQIAVRSIRNSSAERFAVRLQAGLPMALCALLLLGTALLIGQATAGEYWASFLNIARLFAPGVIALLFLPCAPESEGVNPRLERRILVFCAVYLGLFSLWLLRGAWIGGLLPTAVFA